MNCFQVAVLKRASGWTENSREGISKGSGTYVVGSVLALPSSHCFHSDAAFALNILACQHCQLWQKPQFLSKVPSSVFQKYDPHYLLWVLPLVDPNVVPVVAYKLSSQF